MNPFRRSSWFGIVGVLVVMALVVVVALNVDERDADPKGTYALIFGIVGAFLILLFFLQSRDLARAERGEAKTAVPQAQIENPATMDEPTLWASMAVKPIDTDALRARQDVWGAARGSIRLGVLICVLIFLSVPPIYLLDTFVPLLIGAPLIAIIALWKSVPMLAGGGDIGRAYETANRAMKPLGLALTEKLSITIEPKSVAPFRLGPGVHGATAFEGERHGRRVTVRMPADESTRAMCQVFVRARAPECEFRSRDGRLQAADGAPEAFAEALKSVPNSPRWNGLKGTAGPDGIVVEHKGVGHGDWLLDLWLAERLAAAV
jgi:hypothetical protein